MLWNEFLNKSEKQIESKTVFRTKLKERLELIFDEVIFF